MSESGPPTRALYLDLGDGVPVELPRHGRLVIGRDGARADVVLTARGVDDVHCAIGRRKTGGWAVMDLGSDAGTKLNGERVTSEKIAAGDELELGEARIGVVRAATLAADQGQPAAAPAKAPEVDEPPAPRRDAPDELGGYRLERRLGRGSMGDVWLATQTSLDRKVALKMLAERLASNQRFVERFRIEARAAARLNHPNIVTAYDVGEDQGRHFLSMEYMEGGSLQSRLERVGRFPWAEALAAVTDAALGLVYAESRGIVHRDIKPDNLMLGADGTVKIADLGLAVQIEQDGVEGERGKVFGTPHFLAPELLRGEPASTRSDLYALGTTAYQLIAGRTPFDGADARSIARSILNDTPPPLGNVVRGVPDGVERVVHRLLAKDPGERPASAQAALDELRAAVSKGSAGGGGQRRVVALLAVIVAAGGAAWFALGGGDGEEPGGGADPTVADGGGTASDVGAAGEADAGGPPTGPERADDDVELTEPTPEEIFEADAERALLSIGDEVLGDDARIARLRGLAETYRGTDAARRALEQAQALESADGAAASAAEALARLRAAYLGAVREAAAAPSAQDALRAIAAIALPSGDLAGDAETLEAREAIVVDDVARGSDEIEAALVRADAAEAALDYAATGAALRDALAIEVLPPPEERPPELDSAPPPPVLTRLETLRAQAQERLGEWSLSEADFKAMGERRERAAVARALGSSLASELEGLDALGAAARLETAANETSEPEFKARLAASAETLRRADAALEALIEGWDTPGWRRLSLRDPRKRDGSRVEVVGVAPPRALMVTGSKGSGTPEKLPLATFGVHTDALADLLEPRLTTGWTADEAVAVAELLAATASVEAATALRPVLGGSGRSFRFDASARSRALAAYDLLRDWRCEYAEAHAVIERHRRAVEALVDALDARAQGDLATSATRLERLLTEQRTTYIVMLLSDGGRR